MRSSDPAVPSSLTVITAWGALPLLLIACATNAPRRSAEVIAQDTPCDALYSASDKNIWAVVGRDDSTEDQRNALLKTESRNIKANRNSSCWTTSYEPHKSGSTATYLDYDLLYAEFDDQGLPTDVQARGIGFGKSEVYLIESTLSDLLKKADAEFGGINLVVFTYGWHGNAAADNNYSIEFRAILEKIGQQEAQSFAARKKLDFVHGGEKVQLHPRRTVGVEIAWRGDSFEHPALPFYPPSKNALNIWDRKNAAETVAKGSVHELLAFLHEFYLTNSCHDASPRREESSAQCDHVHMLTLGHSFGALVNFNTLISRVENGLNAGCGARAYAFGDLTVLLNPAFEGARYAPAFQSAMHHPQTFGPYPGGTEGSETCVSTAQASDQNHLNQDQPNATGVVDDEVQLPVLITLQSKGDSATGTFFPIFRYLTTLFSNTPYGDESRDERDAIGWIDTFRTHHLGLRIAGAGNACVIITSEPPWHCPNGWTHTMHPDAAVGVSSATEEGVYLASSGVTSGPRYPDYMPFWSVLVDSNIMRDHDDIWNPRIVSLIAGMFRDAFDQSDLIFYRRAARASGASSVRPTGAELESIPLPR
jgi:hypothetical protein